MIISICISILWRQTRFDSFLRISISYVLDSASVSFRGLLVTIDIRTKSLHPQYCIHVYTIRLFILLSKRPCICLVLQIVNFFVSYNLEFNLHKRPKLSCTMIIMLTFAEDLGHTMYGYDIRNRVISVYLSLKSIIKQFSLVLQKSKQTFVIYVTNVSCFVWQFIENGLNSTSFQKIHWTFRM